MNLYIPKNSNYNIFFTDPNPSKPKQLSIVYKNAMQDKMQIILNENSELILIQVADIIKATYGTLNDDKNIDVTTKIKRLLSNNPIERNLTNTEYFKKKNETVTVYKEVMENTISIRKNINDEGIKAILWKPSGGLGHCLHNLSWVCNKAKEEKCKLYIYGCEKHIPFQEKFVNVINIIDKHVVYEEIYDLDIFFTKYKITEDYKKIVTNSDYKTGFKYLDKNKSIGFVCATWSNKLTNVVSLNVNYLNNIINNPLKYYSNDYALINTIKTKQMTKFEISGSYVKSLGVTNKHLKITDEDKSYLKVPKTLIIKYKNNNGEIKTVELKEQTNHTITDISEIIICTYGILDKIRDVTKKVVTSLCTYENKPRNGAKENDIIRSILHSGSYIAVHYRGRDKKTPGGEKKKIKEINEVCNRYNINNVFIATDCPRFYDYVCKNTTDLTIFRYTNPPPDGLNVHYNTKQFKKGENLYKTLLDLCICKKSKYFIHSNGSGFSTMISELK